MHFHPEKVTSTCSQRFAELHPHCPGMLLAPQSRRRCLPAEPDLPAPTLVNMTDVVHTEPAGHFHAWPGGPEGRVMTRGQSLAVTVAASTRQIRLQLVTTPNCGNCCQLPSSSHVAGALK